MSDALLIALVSAVVNGAVTWGVVSTKLAWLRRDVDFLLEQHERRQPARATEPRAAR